MIVVFLNVEPLHGVKIFIGIAPDSEEEISLESRTGDLEIDGLTSLTDLFDETGIEIPQGPYKTVSGFVMHFLGRMPKVHDVVNLNGIRIVVLTLEGHRVGQLLISRSQ